MKRESTITDWVIENMGDWYRLNGYCLNDDRWPDGVHIHTSMLERIDFEKGIAETRNTIYRLA